MLGDSDDLQNLGQFVPAILSNLFVTIAGYLSVHHANHQPESQRKHTRAHKTGEKVAARFACLKHSVYSLEAVAAAWV